MRNVDPPEVRFLQRVDIRGEDECWPWLGHTLRSGHGKISIGGGVRVGAHRYALIRTGVNIPKGMLVCHKCNNPKCVNPKHLYVGTPKDNARDSINAGTFHFPHPGRGEAHANAKLTREKVDRAIEMKKSGRSLRSIAKEYGVSIGALSKVWRGETWV